MSLRHIIDNKTRIGLLKQRIKKNKFVRIMEVHNGLSALIANDLKIELDKKILKEFDGFWESSLTDSASKGYPDIELVGLDSRLETINQILEVTDKPLIVDGDTGGDVNQFEYMVKRLERAGVSAVIIEDKVFPKRNSLEEGTIQKLEKPELFAEKIKRGFAMKRDSDFMIIARIESLIAGHGLKDALERARIYLRAGADGIMIHSKSEDPVDIFSFSKDYHMFPKNLIRNKILVAVPTKYNTVTDNELKKAGFQIVIHANHQLRASYKAMLEVCQSILINDRSFEADNLCASIKEIFEKVGFLDVKEKDKETAEKFKSKIKIIIPAAGVSDLAKKTGLPIALIDINGKTVLQRQIETLSKLGLDNINVIKGYRSDKFKLENVNYYVNKEYETSDAINSIFKAESALNSPLICIYSDILFNQNIIASLLLHAPDTRKNIVLVVDDSYEYHIHNLQKKLDLVYTNRGNIKEPRRKLRETTDEKIVYIGKRLTQDVAHYEFIGISYFSQKGLSILKDVYFSIVKKGLKNNKRNRLSFTDVIQEVVNRGYSVYIMKTHKGWMEIHNSEDVRAARKLY